MRALLLAAGWGTRLGAGERGHAKALLPLGGRRAIDWAADAAEALAEVRAVDVLANEASRPALARWAEARRGRAPLRVLGNGVARLGDRRGAVVDLAAYLAEASPDEDLLVLAADNVFDFELAPLAAGSRVAPTVVTFDVGSAARVRRYASVRLAPDGRVAALVEKDPNPPSSLAVTALYGIPRAHLPDVAAYLASGGAPDNLGHLAEWWCAAGQLRAVRAEGLWIDVGTPDDLATARLAVKKRGQS